MEPKMIKGGLYVVYNERKQEVGRIERVGANKWEAHHNGVVIATERTKKEAWAKLGDALETPSEEQEEAPATATLPAPLSHLPQLLQDRYNRLLNAWQRAESDEIAEKIHREQVLIRKLVADETTPISLLNAVEVHCTNQTCLRKFEDGELVCHLIAGGTYCITCADAEGLSNEPPVDFVYAVAPERKRHGEDKRMLELAVDDLKAAAERFAEVTGSSLEAIRIGISPLTARADDFYKMFDHDATISSFLTERGIPWYHTSERGDFNRVTHRSPDKKLFVDFYQSRSKEEQIAELERKLAELKGSN